MEETLSRIRVVLVRTSHPGNIGAAARAMKTMGLADRRLVTPERFPAPEAEWMASNASDVLARARVHAELTEAIADCVAAYALSALLALVGMSSLLFKPPSRPAPSVA